MGKPILRTTFRSYTRELQGARERIILNKEAIEAVNKALRSIDKKDSEAVPSAMSVVTDLAIKRIKRDRLIERIICKMIHTKSLSEGTERKLNELLEQVTDREK